MRFIVAFILLITLFSISRAQNYSIDVTGLVIRGGPTCGNSTNWNENLLNVAQGNGACTPACSGNSYRVTQMGSVTSTGQPTYTVQSFAKNGDCSNTAVGIASNIKCPALNTETGRSPAFDITLSNDVTYQFYCVYRKVSTVAPTETPAGNSADKIAISIAIIFGALISLLAL